MKPYVLFQQYIWLVNIIHRHKKLTFEELCAYDEMSYVEKAAYASANQSKAITCAVYLAYEKAHIEGGTAPITLKAVMGVGDAMSTVDVAALTAVVRSNLEAAAPAFAQDAATAIASLVNAGINNYAIPGYTEKLVGTATAADILTVYGYIAAEAPEAAINAKAKEVALSIVKSEANAALVEKMAKDG